MGNIINYQELCTRLNYILELKRQFYPLSTRKKTPTDYGCIEKKVASEIFGIWGRRHSKVPIPPKDMIGFVLFFICECPDNEWKELKCPYSLFTANQLAPSQSDSIDDFAILGEDVALIASLLMNWYGSIEVFDVLRREWTFNLDESCLERKGTFSRLMID